MILHQAIRYEERGPAVSRQRDLAMSFVDPNGLDLFVYYEFADDLTEDQKNSFLST